MLVANGGLSLEQITEYERDFGRDALYPMIVPKEKVA